MAKKQTVKRLVVPFQLKASVDPKSHTFEGLVAVIGQKDLGNDIIEPGAFKNTLAEWKGSGNALPLLNSHDQYNIMSALGQLIDAKETKDGLWSKWEVIPGPEGDAVMARLTPSAVTGRPIIGKMSIGYCPVKWEIEQPDDTTSYWDQIRHLTEIDWKEGSLVLFPMAPGAAIDASTVKSFLLSAQATEAKTLDYIAKSELRKLATRIGILLKQDTPLVPPTTEEKDDSSTDEETPIPPKKKPKAKVPAKADPEHPGSDDEDDDDLDAVADLSKDDALDEDEAGDEEGDDDDEVDPKKKVKKAVDPLDLEIKRNQPYVYQEALAHRLRTVGLKHKVAAIGSDDEE